MAADWNADVTDLGLIQWLLTFICFFALSVCQVLMSKDSKYWFDQTPNLSVANSKVQHIRPNKKSYYFVVSNFLK